MMDNKFLEQHTNKSKTMPPRLLLLITHAKALLAPSLGIGSLWAFIELIDVTSNPVIGVVGTAIIAFFTYLATRMNARTKVEVKTIETKGSSDTDRAAFGLQLFDRATADIERARLHFTEELKSQRIDFFEKEKENQDKFLAKLDEARAHYEQRQDELRHGYHDRLKEASSLSEKYITKCTKIEIQLKSLGIGITDECELILPASFERRQTDRGT